jgi:excinuclease UvrABC nuclease subunit
MSRKTVPFNKRGIENLPNSKPAIYKIMTEGAKNNYTGMAQKGRLRERLSDHLPGGKDPVPGAKITIEQVRSKAEAQKKEQAIIARSKPKYNKQGK